MIDTGQMTMIEADVIEPFEDRVDILFRELELATKWQCPSLLLAIYNSEYIHGDAQAALESRLESLGQKAHRILVKSQDDADIALMISELANLKDVVVFVDGLRWGCGQADYSAYRSLDKHREFFIENRIRIVFWLTETEAIHLAHYAPDYWTFRHRVIEFVDSPKPELLQPAMVASNCQCIDEISDTGEDLDAKITLRAALLTDLPEGAESTASRANLLLTLGILHWRRGDNDQASRFLHTALELTPKLQDDRFEALCCNAIALVETALGRLQGAVHAYERAAELAPDQITPWNNLGNLHLKLKEYEQAVSAYQKAVEQNPADPQGWASLAQAYSCLDRHPDAIFAYRKSLELDPANATAWVSLGDLYSAEGQWDDALVVYQKALELQPDHGRVWNDLGGIHYQAGAYTEAQQDYEQAIRLNAATSQTYTNLALLQILAGEQAKAVPLYQKSIELQADPAEAAELWNRLGDAYRKLEDYDNAMAAYRKSDELTHQAPAAAAAVEEVVLPLAGPAIPDQPAEEASFEPPVEKSTLSPLAEQAEANALDNSAESLPAFLASAEPAEPTPPPAMESPLEDTLPLEIAQEAAPAILEPPLLDDSATLKDESPLDFAQWLQDLASRTAVSQSVEPEPAPTLAEEVDELADTRPIFILSPVAAAEVAEAVPTESSADPLEDPNPYPRFVETELSFFSSGQPAPTETLPASPDVRSKLDDLRAAISERKYALPIETDETESGEDAPHSSEPAVPCEEPAQAGSVLSEETVDTMETLQAEPAEAAIVEASASIPSPEPVEAVQAPMESQAPTAVKDSGSSATAQIWNELGNIYYNIVAYDEAINALNKAIELDQTYGWTYNNLASIYIHKGSYAQAIPLLEKGIPLMETPKDRALLWNRLGDAYRRLDQPDKAALAYKKAVELDPENVSLLTRARFSLLGNCRA